MKHLKQKTIKILFLCLFIFNYTSVVTSQVGPQQPKKPATLCEAYGSSVFLLTIGGPTATKASDVWALYNSATLSGTIYIKADFTVDVNFTFLNSKIKMAPGVKIIVEPNVKLTINNSKLFSCNQMWKGIELMYNAEIVSNNNTQIEDAEIAIKARCTANLTIKQTVFNRNTVGIQFGIEETVFDPCPSYPFFTQFNSNVFDCTSPLTGTTDSISEAGIKTFKSPLSLTLGYVNANKFRNMQNGIYMKGQFSGLTSTINACYFEKIKNNAIYLDEGSLNVSSCNFMNCTQNSIRMDITRAVEIKSCHFNYTNTLEIIQSVYGTQAKGINLLAFGLNSKVDINYNEFLVDFLDLDTNPRREVSCVNLKGGNVASGTNIHVYKNIFDVIVKWNSFGVFLDGEFNINTSVTIEQNNFTFERYTNGGYDKVTPITCKNGNKNNLKIINNTLKGKKQNGEGIANYGIRLEGSETGISNKVSGNNFPLVYFDFNLPVSLYDYNFSQNISVNNFANTTYCSNFSSFANRAGFKFVGNCIGTDFIANEMQEPCYRDLSLEGIIGDQMHKGNQWVSNNLGNSTINADCPNPDNAATSRFYVHVPQSTPTNPNQYHPAIITAANWFVDTVGAPATGCLEQFTDPNSGGTEERIANGTINKFISSPLQQRQLRKYLYYKLKNNINIHRSENLNAFLAAESTGNLEKLYQVNQGIENAIKASATIDSKTKAYYANTSTPKTLKSMYQADSVFSEAQKQYYQERNKKLLDVLKLNATINTNIPVEQNEKSINTLYIYYLITNNKLTQPQQQELKRIAGLCPEIAGNAVYIARGLLPQSEQLDWEKVQNCQGQTNEPERESRSIESKENVEAPNEVKVFPNPTTQFVRIDSNQEISEMFFYDVTGIRVMIVKSDFSQIDVSSLKKGIYILSARLKNGETQFKQLVIQ